MAHLPVDRVGGESWRVRGEHPGAAGEKAGRWQAGWHGAAGRAWLALVLVLALGLVFPADGAFHQWATHRDALRQSSVYGILACGLTVVILSGGIDLSVGSVLALVAVVTARLAIHLGWPAWLVVTTALAVGALLGGVNGWLTARLGLQPFIATLATMVFARGLAKWSSGGMKVSTAVPEPDGSFRYLEVPALFRWIDTRVLGGNLSVVTILFLACAVLCGMLLGRHAWGRWWSAIGGNEEAARRSGVPVERMKAGAYVLSGLLAAVAGICQAAQEQQGDPETGAGYELIAIAMVVMGGTKLTGGEGGIGRTLLGVLTVGYLEKILSIHAVPESGRLMLMGVLIVLAVLTQGLGRR
ncbi:ABC transporter permease [Limisphaera sp. 4302-co]